MPKNLSKLQPNFKVEWIPVQDILLLTPPKALNKWLEKFEAKQNIQYLSVKKKDVVELCSACHRKRHKK